MGSTEHVLRSECLQLTIGAASNLEQCATRLEKNQFERRGNTLALAATNENLGQRLNSDWQAH